MSTVPSRLSVVTVGARDIAALRSFYRSLGWPELPASDDGWSAFLLGGVLFALYPLPELAAEAAPGVPAPAEAGPGSPWPATSTAATRSTRRSPRRRGGRDGGGGADRPVLGWALRLHRDPEGNRWEIAWAGTARFDERGALLSFG